MIYPKGDLINVVFGVVSFLRFNSVLVPPKGKAQSTVEQQTSNVSEFPMSVKRFHTLCDGSLGVDAFPKAGESCYRPTDQCDECEDCGGSLWVFNAPEPPVVKHVRPGENFHFKLNHYCCQI